VLHGVALPIGGECGDPRVVVELGAAAEEAGWDGIFLEDYVFYQGAATAPTCDPWAALAALALRTERVQLGIGVVALPRRRPWLVARQAAAVDQLSEGRLVLGAGIGDAGDPGFTHTHEPLDLRLRGELLDEGLDIIAGLFTGEPFSYHGSHYTLGEVELLPPPVRQPRPPIWIGGGYPNHRAVERALRFDGACMYRREGGHLRAADVFELRGRAAGRPFTIAVGGQQRRRDWDEEAAEIESVADAGADWWIEAVEPGDLASMRGAVSRGPMRARDRRTGLGIS
jgi:alkanesulfonate monooxygenase SsuD/methylene tetrahydromethanopterin reductase-like flavin-dependent oxidoreductase (luciferase family)